MAPAEGWHAQIEKCKQFSSLLELPQRKIVDWVRQTMKLCCFFQKWKSFLLLPKRGGRKRCVQDSTSIDVIDLLELAFRFALPLRYGRCSMANANVHPKANMCFNNFCFCSQKGICCCFSFLTLLFIVVVFILLAIPLPCRLRSMRQKFINFKVFCFVSNACSFSLWCRTMTRKRKRLASMSQIKGYICFANLQGWFKTQERHLWDSSPRRETHRLSRPTP